MTPIIHIVDDNTEVRHSLSVLLGALDYRFETHVSGDAFLVSDCDLDTSIILLDIRMPGRDGMEVLKELRTRSKLAQIIMMTGHGDVPLAVRAIQDGANDFLEKPFEANHIQKVLIQAQEKIVKSDPFEALTPRERQTADLLSKGHANKEIAFQLGISTRTVEAHRARIMSKLNIHSSAELVRLMLTT